MKNVTEFMTRLVTGDSRFSYEITVGDSERLVAVIHCIWGMDGYTVNGPFILDPKYTDPELGLLNMLSALVTSRAAYLGWRAPDLQSIAPG